MVFSSIFLCSISAYLHSHHPGNLHFPHILLDFLILGLVFILSQTFKFALLGECEVSSERSDDGHLMAWEVTLLHHCPFTISCRWPTRCTIGILHLLDHLHQIESFDHENNGYRSFERNAFDMVGKK